MDIVTKNTASDFYILSKIISLLSQFEMYFLPLKAAARQMMFAKNSQEVVMIPVTSIVASISYGWERRCSRQW